MIISPVCSTDDIAGETFASNQTEDVVSAQNNEVILENESLSDEGTFEDLYFEIDAVEEGGLLTLTRDYINVNDSNVYIPIEKSITIDGNGHTLNANNLSGIFEVDADGVVLKNINFINGFSNYDCSAINVFGNLSVINCNFENNNVLSKYFGAVLYSEDIFSVDIKNCTFMDNNCPEIISARGNFNIEDSKLINNSGRYSLFCPLKGKNGYVGNIKNTIIYSAKTRLKISISAADFNVSDCDFTNSYFDYDDNTYSLNVLNTSFKDCDIDVSSYNKKKLSKSNFINCSFHNSSFNANGVNLTIFNSQFTNSSSKRPLQSADCDIIIKKSSFINNSVENIGGALFFNRGSLNISETVFENNHAYNGGALAIFSNDFLYIENNLFKNNRAKYFGGAIYSIKDVGKNNTFVNNSASDFNDSFCIKSEGQFSEFVFTDMNSTFYHMNYDNVSDIPVYFNLADEGLMTPVKNQGESGACWSFSAIASIESSILKLSGIPLDLSENNMKNLMHYYSVYGRNIEPDAGGFYSTSLGYLTSWIGPVLESEDEFNETSVFSNRLDPAFHIQNAIFIGDAHHSDLSLIKKAIMTYGPVVTSVFMLADEENDYKQCVDDMYSSNHAVPIVGWDDEMEIPGAPQKGAWILKNSYGSDWGYDGYFYVSYYDQSYSERIGLENFEIIGFDGFVFEFCDNINYEKNYQYEFGVSHFYINNSTRLYKNVFYSTDDEYLAATSTYFNRDCEWQLYVYVNDELNQSKEGFSKAGYHTIELDNFIPLKAGDKFEVVFKLLTDGVYIPFSCSDDFAVDFSNENQSFISEDGLTWKDLSDFAWIDSYFISHNSQTACIKAFTILNTVGTTLNLTVDFDGINSANFTAYVLNQYGIPLNKGEVAFNVSGNVIRANVSQGIAKISAVLSGGLNSINAQFSAVGFNSSSNSTSINAKARTSIKASSIQTVYNVNKYLTVTLKDADGKAIVGAKLTIKLNSAKTYKTDEKGQVKINVKSLVPRTYSAKITFSGNDEYIKSSAAVKVVVKKAKPKLVAKKKTFKVKTKIKKYTIVLKTNKNKALKKVKVTLKVKGKTYKAKTNSKGKATFKITKLIKKGKFTAKVKFTGNKYYKAVTKSVKITVRK